MKKSIKYILTTTLCLVAAMAVMAQSRITREEYINRYKQIAIDHMERYGIPASITMAQGLLESDSGNSLLSKSSNNHFGIKCKSNWTGATVTHDDDEKGECFRAYPSVEESYRDHAEFLDNSPRYDSLFAYSSTDYRSWARGLKAAGYATAPHYADLLIKLIEDNNLSLLDKEDGEELYAEKSTEDSHQYDSTTSGDIDPNNFQTTINSHKGYNIYRVNGKNYILTKQDDSYETLSETFRISASSIRRFNELDRDHTFVKGEMVFIEGKDRHYKGKLKDHEVIKGETLHSISQIYGIKSSSLRRLNDMKRKDEVREGRAIILQ